MNRFVYALDLTYILMLVSIGCLFFGPMQLIVEQKAELLSLLFVIPVFWYFAVVDALLFGNYSIKDF